MSSALVGRFFTRKPPGEAPMSTIVQSYNLSTIRHILIPGVIKKRESFHFIIKELGYLCICYYLSLECFSLAGPSPVQLVVIRKVLCGWIASQKHFQTLLRQPFCCCCSVAKLCPTLCDPKDCSAPDSSVLHSPPDFAQSHVHWVGITIQPFHPLLPLLLPFFWNWSYPRSGIL